MIISDEKINYTKVNQPNVLVCLTQEAYGKFAGIIRPDEVRVTDLRFVTTQRKVAAVQYELPMFETIMDKMIKQHAIRIPDSKGVQNGPDLRLSSITIPMRSKFLSTIYCIVLHN